MGDAFAYFCFALYIFPERGFVLVLTLVGSLLIFERDLGYFYHPVTFVSNSGISLVRIVIVLAIHITTFILSFDSFCSFFIHPKRLKFTPFFGDR